MKYTIDQDHVCSAEIIFVFMLAVRPIFHGHCCNF